jgi:starch phosphorylase
MYGEGYLHQHIRSDGWQDDIQETLDRDAAPVTRVIAKHDRQLVVKVPFIDPPIYVAVWKVDVGRVPLYLMDTDIDENEATYRSIFSRLYTGDPEWRLRQEIVLGIGGSEVLNKLGIEHSIVHLNEGHTAFVLLEKLRKQVEAGAMYEEAVHQVQSTSIFTTHTPVPAGHDRYSAALIDKYFSDYYPLLQLDRNRFFQLGFNPSDSQGIFNMTALAMRLSGYRNAVSREHGMITRRMWHPLWTEVSEDQVPIDYITNGVHLPTWLGPKMELLFGEHLGRYYSQWLEHHDSPTLWQLVDEIPDRALWQVHQSLKRQLFNRIREFKRWKWLEGEAEPINVVAGGTLLDPNALTIGFARRFTSYKRADLIFSDIERLKRLVNNWWRPVQIIFAGKAHPADVEGKKILQRIYEFTQRPDFGGRVAFVEDYGEQVAQYMVHGVDLWLNTPIRTLEASGTSGMKASMNGVLHLSIPTGWWIEGYNGKNGWTVGREVSDKGNEKDDAQILYDILENEVVPLYYTVSEDGTPHPWIKKMKEAIKSTAPQFCARRMVKEYIQRYYLPALKSCSENVL